MTEKEQRSMLKQIGYCYAALVAAAATDDAGDAGRANAETATNLRASEGAHQQHSRPDAGQSGNDHISKNAQLRPQFEQLQSDTKLRGGQNEPESDRALQQDGALQKEQQSEMLVTLKSEPQVREYEGDQRASSTRHNAEAPIERPPKQLVGQREQQARPSDAREAPSALFLALANVPREMEERMDSQLSGWRRWPLRAADARERDVDAVATASGAREVVYLSADAEEELTELRVGTLYVVGGIVDRNRLKRATLDRAAELSAHAMRLPISSAVHSARTRVLAVNHVVELLARVSAGASWPAAAAAVIPARRAPSAADSGARSASAAEPLSSCDDF
mmetsp:Transcript_6347/g.16933  ORF Transcript_6347/g.16933 Transcript_6347/m.16933 type:complete len:336 (-) Transcript_6347:335-1342(-)